MGPLGELGALFNPGMRHEIEERKSKANRREEEGNARDGDLRIDLASGVAVINLSANGDHGASPADTAAPQQNSTRADAGDATAPQCAPKHRLKAEAGHHELPAGEPDADRSGTGRSASAAADTDDDADSPAQAPVSSGATVNLDPGVRSPTAAPVTAAQARRLAAAARRSAGGDRPARPAIQRPANAPLPSSKASRAAR